MKGESAGCGLPGFPAVLRSIFDLPGPDICICPLALDVRFRIGLAYAEIR
jgi:hypothetical protein